MTNTSLDPRLGQPAVHLVDDGGAVRDALRRGRAGRTARRAEVMRLAITGHPNKVVADDLCIGVRTVQAHRARKFEKMNVTSVVALAHPLRQAGVGVGEGFDGR